MNGAAVAGVAEGEEAHDAGEQAPRAGFLRLDPDLIVPLALHWRVDVDDVLGPEGKAREEGAGEAKGHNRERRDAAEMSDGGVGVALTPDLIGR